MSQRDVLYDLLHELAGVNDEIQLTVYHATTDYAPAGYRANAVKSIEEMRGERDRLEAELIKRLRAGIQL